MGRSTLLIRLAVATTVSVASALFVEAYCLVKMSVVRAGAHGYLPPDRLLEWLPGYTRFVVHCRWYALFVPAFFFGLGMVALHRWKIPAAFELAIGCQWLFAVLWAGLCLLVWMLPEIRTSR